MIDDLTPYIKESVLRREISFTYLKQAASVMVASFNAYIVLDCALDEKMSVTTVIFGAINAFALLPSCGLFLSAARLRVSLQNLIKAKRRAGIP